MSNSNPSNAALAVAVFALVLAGCASAPTSAPVIDRTPAARPGPSAARAQRSHVVRRGDTLYSIALENGVDYRELARWNDLDNASRIRVGQRLRLSAPDHAGAMAAQPARGVEVGKASGSGAVEARPLDPGALSAQGQGDGNTKTEPKALRLPYTPENLALLSKNETPSRGAAPGTAPVATGTATKPAQTKPAPEANAATKPEPKAVPRDPDAIDFMWPAKGKLLAGYTARGNKGLDISGNPGDPVLAAAPGRVMYTGTGIRGYGKLIVIKHDKGFNSVYAHNRAILVKEGQTVTQGQKIAELGASDSDKPKLHFEIRKSGKPVDPMLYLPGATPG